MRFIEEDLQVSVFEISSEQTGCDDLIRPYSDSAGSYDAEGLFFPVGKRAPNPLERAKAKLAEPQGTEDEKYGPDENDDPVELIALEFVEQTQARDVEDRYADEGSENVIGEGHLADFGESAGDRL